MNKKQFKRGIKRGIGYDHLRGRLDAEMVLEDLGIDVSYRQGSQIMCHCPDLKGYHSNGDASPSFGYKEEYMAFNCFVCGGGSVVELVRMMRPEMKDDDEAVEYLEQFAGKPATPEELLARVTSIMNPEVEEDNMPDYPLDSLFLYRKIHPYLYERGLTKEVIVEMQVGFDDVHCGITIPHMFQGKLRGWQIRHLAMQGDQFICDFCEAESGKSMAKGKKVSKYKNTARFPKQNTLYGYDRFKEKLKGTEADSVIVVESPMTALKLMSMGFANVVATFGQFSIEQGMLLIAMKTVYFWPDNDSAGFENAVRCISSLGRYTTVKIVPCLPDKKGDAADLDTKEEIQEYLDASYEGMLFPLISKEKLATLYEVQNAYQKNNQ